MTIARAQVPSIGSFAPFRCRFAFHRPGRTPSAAAQSTSFEQGRVTVWPVHSLLAVLRRPLGRHVAGLSVWPSWCATISASRSVRPASASATCSTDSFSCARQTLPSISIARSRSDGIAGSATVACTAVSVSTAHDNARSMISAPDRGVKLSRFPDGGEPTAGEQTVYQARIGQFAQQQVDLARVEFRATVHPAIHGAIRQTQCLGEFSQGPALFMNHDSSNELTEQVARLPARGRHGMFRFHWMVSGPPDTIVTGP